MLFFFFQAEDGIRDLTVTGVQTCALPISNLVGVWGGPGRLGATIKFVIYTMAGSLIMLAALIVYGLKFGTFDLVDGPTSISRWLRSEERRGGKEGRSRWAPDH